jgi:hypothetical protein
MQTNDQASSGILTHDPSIRAGEDSPCLKPRDNCDWFLYTTLQQNVINICLHAIISSYIFRHVRLKAIKIYLY